MQAATQLQRQQERVAPQEPVIRRRRVHRVAHRSPAMMAVRVARERRVKVVRPVPALLRPAVRRDEPVALRMAARLLAALALHRRPAIQGLPIHAADQAAQVVRTRLNLAALADGPEAVAVVVVDQQEAEARAPRA